jgi:hypothetical protein
MLGGGDEGILLGLVGGAIVSGRIKDGEGFYLGAF